MSDSYEFKIKATETGRIEHTPYRCRADDESDTLRTSLARVTAELAEVKARRCETCGHYIANTIVRGHWCNAWSKQPPLPCWSCADYSPRNFVVAHVDGARQAPDKGASGTGMPGDD
jgi:hypothetical protein